MFLLAGSDTWSVRALVCLVPGALLLAFVMALGAQLGIELVNADSPENHDGA